MAAILNSTILDSAILHKNTSLMSFWLNLMIAAILNSAMMDSATVILNSDTLLSSPDSLKNTLTPLWLWFKLIQLSLHSESDSNNLINERSAILNLPSWIQPFWTEKKLHSFILTQLHDGSHLQFYHLGFSHYAQKHFTHSFWLNLMMAAILNSAMLYSNTAILDSDTLLSSLRFTQKHSHSTLTLTQTHFNSHLTWWWQPSWILPSWIWPSWIQPS